MTTNRRIRAAQPSYYPHLDETGATDVTDDLMDFLASVPDGATIDLGDAATYKVEGTWEFLNRADLTIRAHGSTFVAETIGASDRAHIRVITSTDITFYDLNIQGCNPDAGDATGTFLPELAGQHGFASYGANGLNIIRCGIQDNYGDFIYLGQTGALYTQNVQVLDGNFTRSGRQGIALVGTRYVLIQGNAIDHVKRSTIDLEPAPTAGRSVLNVQILANTSEGGRLTWIAANGGGPVNNVLVANNVLTDKTMGINVQDLEGDPEVGRRSNWIVTNNTSDAFSGSGSGTPVTGNQTMLFLRIDGLTVTNNVQPMKPGRQMYLIGQGDCTDLTVSGNTGVNMVGQVKTV